MTTVTHMDKAFGMTTHACSENKPYEIAPSVDLMLQSSGSKPQPFLKWAGGKTQLLKQIAANLPTPLQSGRIRKYAEPFIGGGAVFFYIANKFDIDEFYISDINKELILAYRTIQRDVDTLIQLLEDMEKAYYPLDTEEQSSFFYKTRDEFNDAIPVTDYETFSGYWTERTAQIIFLNRTCFNGLFRVNSQSRFNVPFGRYKNPRICSTENLRQVASLLQRAEICVGDFESCASFIDDDTFVYFDPPYRPISATANFTSYSCHEFDEQAQMRLCAFFRHLDTRGAKLMLSNSDPKNENPNDEFFDNIYRNYNIKRIQANRMINCNPVGRGRITEVLVMNY